MQLGFFARPSSQLPTLTCLLRARADLAAVFGTTPVVIAFDGVETGRIEVVAKAPKPSDPAFVSGACDGALSWRLCLCAAPPLWSSHLVCCKCTQSS